ncbi:single-stranded DNA-binding protein [Rhodococcoides fascians]|uniref:single-stranded DNA-binding protein n=1 Tax=Rhodococcoides fascians TaxID=1828 RepID=UPI00050C33FA|nr:single-stranded DNA-binding protein [Rhodococcus fascians]
MSQAVAQIVGTLGGDPELRFTPQGLAVVNMSVAVTERVRDGEGWKDGDTTWYRANAWRQLAENIGESLKKGDQVVILGRVKNRPYEKEGQTRYSLEIEIDEIGASLRFATARPQKAGRSNTAAGNNRQQNQPQNDPWGSAPASPPPF